MKIIVLNGSPKGKASVTMQYVRFIQKKFPQHELKILDIAQKIKWIEKDDNTFQDILEEIRSADGVLWAYPLYVFLVASQYKRFIELIFERKAGQVFKDKYSALLSTSINFFDHTARNYMNGICDDLRMKLVDSFSANMTDLFKKEEKDKLIFFAKRFFNSIENKESTSRTFAPVSRLETIYDPGETKPEIDIAASKKVLLLTDARSGEANLNRMIEKFKGTFMRNIEVINLNDVDIKGGCLGCIHCGIDNECVYEGKDGFIDFYNSKIKTADILIFAGTIKDRYLSSRWKLFFDRSFFNTHQPVLSGKQIGFIISGPLRQIPNTRQILESFVEWQQANIIGIVTDEYKDSIKVDNLLKELAKRSIVFSDKKYIKPQTFLGVGGRKIFRDDIWGKLRFVFQADHKYYKKTGFYDFPQNDFKTRATNLLMIFMTRIPKFKRGFQKDLKDLTVEPYRKAADKEDSEKAKKTKKIPGVLIVSLSFIPWIIYWVLSGMGSTLAIIIPLAVTFTFVSFRAIRKRYNIMDLFSFIYFIAAAIVTFFTDSMFFMERSGSLGYIVLFVMAVFSLVIGRPYTIEGVKNDYPQSFWKNPMFTTINTVITVIWAIIFIVNSVLFVILNKPLPIITTNILIGLGVVLSIIIPKMMPDQ